MLLYDLEYKYKSALENALDTIKNGCTLEEFLDLGFNNATLLNPFEEYTTAKDIKDLYAYEKGEYSYDLTEDMLETKVVLSGTCRDGDGYTCVYIVCENDNDFKKFEKLLEEEK